jgi:glyoxylate reductase
VPRPRVLVTRRVPPPVIDHLRAGCDVEVHDSSDDLSNDELRARLGGMQGALTVITDRVDAATLDAAPGLRVVANIAVGYDNIDVTAADRRGVVVTNTPDVLTDAVADLAIAMLLDLTRRVTEGDRLVRRGGWRGWALDFMLGTELRGRQLGIVGLGRIGAAVGQRAEAFGMRVAFVARPERDEGRRALVRPGWQGLTFDELLSTSDAISVHVPLGPTTRHLIDRRALGRMKPGAVLVNTSRGPVVDEAALADVLRAGRIGGAALDVFEDEPRVHAGLLDLENVLLVPHLGSATHETRTAMADLAARNVLAVLAGRPPLTPVTPRGFP